MTILQMNIYGSLLIIFAIIIRSVALNKFPKKIFTALWLIAISRLLIPYTMPQVINVYPAVSALNELSGDRFIPAQPQDEFTPLNSPDISESNTPINEEEPVSQITSAAKKANITVYTVIWLAGVFISGIIFIVPHIMHSRKYKASLPMEDDYIDSWVASHRLFRKYKVMVSDEILSPFTYGLFRPVILLSENIDIHNRELIDYILTHEYIHIKRFDIILKWVSAVTLCVNWFNPFVWVMYVLMNRDIELSCDESVVRLKGETNKKSYAMTLLDMESNKVSFNPLVNHFNKNSLKERVTSIMKIKKITVLSMVLAFVLTASSGLILFSACSENTKGEATDVTEKTDKTNEQDSKDKENIDVTEEIPEYIVIKEEKYSTALTELKLSGAELTNYDIKPLKYMVNLTVLDLSVNEIDDISVLAGLTNLTELQLSANEIDDISALAELTNLTQLHLSDNGISDISAVAGLTNLTLLRLENNQISDVGAVTGLINLKTLMIADNQISDISVISELSNLERLFLPDNQISDEQIAELKKVLPDISIY